VTAICSSKFNPARTCGPRTESRPLQNL